MSSINVTTSSSGSATRRIAVLKAISRTAAASSRHQAKNATDSTDESVSPAVNAILTPAINSMCGGFFDGDSRTTTAPLHAKGEGKALGPQKRSLEQESTSGDPLDSPLPRNKKRKIGESSRTAAASSPPQARRWIDPDDALKPAPDSMWGDFSGESIRSAAKKRKVSELDSPQGESSSWPSPIVKKRRSDPETTSITNKFNDKAAKTDTFLATANDSLNSIASTPSTPIQSPPTPSAPIQVPPLEVQPEEQVSERKIVTTPSPISPAARYKTEFQRTVTDWSSKGVLAFVDADDVKLHNVKNGHRSSLGYTFDCTITAVSFHPDGRKLAVGTKDLDCTKNNMIHFFDVKRKKLLTTLEIPAKDGEITAVAWHPFRNIISVGTFEGCLYHFNVLGNNFHSKKPCVLRNKKAHRDAIYGLKWGPDGSLLASSSGDRQVCAWQLESLASPVYQYKHDYCVEAVAWCPWNPHLLAFGGGFFDREIHVWNFETDSIAKTFKSGSQVTSLHWSKHHRNLVSTHKTPHAYYCTWNYTTSEKKVRNLEPKSAIRKKN